MKFSKSFSGEYEPGNQPGKNAKRRALVAGGTLVATLALSSCGTRPPKLATTPVPGHPELSTVNDRPGTYAEGKSNQYQDGSYCTVSTEKGTMIANPYIRDGETIYPGYDDAALKIDGVGGTISYSERCWATASFIVRQLNPGTIQVGQEMTFPERITVEKQG